MRKVTPLLCLLLLSGCSLTSKQDRVKIEEVRFAMGSILTISAYVDAPRERLEIVRCADIVHDLDEKLSNYNPESEISKLNRVDKNVKVKVSEDTFSLLREAQRLSKLTEGAFDVTVRPLVEIWSSASKSNELPSNEELTYARSRIGYEKINLLSPDHIEMRQEGVAIETGGIGKGYAVDRIIDCIEKGGVKDAFLDFGRSSMAAIGSPPDESGWKVQVDLGHGSKLREVELKNRRLSVSRAKGRSQIVEGREIGHLLDPATGEFVTSNAGAYVISNSATEAEALSKALVIRGSRFADKIPSEFEYVVDNGVL